MSSSSSFTQDVFSEDPVFSSGSVRTDTTAISTNGGFQYTGGGGGGAKYARKDYWDLDQILQDEQLIDCRLIDTAYGLGWMNTQAAEVHSYQRQRREAEDDNENKSVAGNTSSGVEEGDANHLPADCKLSFPLWIAEGLYLRRFVEIEEVPAIFNNKMQGLMTLEASVMRLDQKSFYYFEVGMRLAALLGLSAYSQLHTLMERLLRGMFDRTRSIFDVAQTQIVGADQEKRMQVLMDFMTRSERELFHQGIMTAGEYDLFRDGELSKVRQSGVHIAPRKE